MLERFGVALRALKSATFGAKLRLEARKNEVQKPFEKKISKSSKKARAGRLPDGKHRGGWVVNARVLGPTLAEHSQFASSQPSYIEDSKLLTNNSTAFKISSLNCSS